MTNLGYSFNPSTPPIDMNRPGPGGLAPDQGGGPQSAVEIRRLSIPKRLGPNPIAPSALLNSGGAAGAGVNLAQLLPLLMQAFAPQGQQPGVPSLPSPVGAQPGQRGDFSLPGQRIDSEPVNRNAMAPFPGGGYTPSAPPVPSLPALAPPPAPSPAPSLFAPNTASLAPHVAFDPEGRAQSGSVPVDFTNAPTAAQLQANGGQAQWTPSVDASRIPSQIPFNVANDFLTRNPGDYDRLRSAFPEYFR